MNENLIVLYTTEFLLLLAPTKTCLIIVVILYRYNDLSSICNQNTFESDNLKITFLRRGVVGVSKVGYV